MAQRHQDADDLVDQIAAVEIETASMEAALEDANKEMDGMQEKAANDAQSKPHTHDTLHRLLRMFQIQRANTFTS
jgi:hypothetical protein